MAQLFFRRHQPVGAPGDISVGPSGKDFTTIQAAYDVAVAGDIIDVFPGTYTDTRNVTPYSGHTVTTIVNCNKSGTAGNPITIRAVNSSGTPITTSGGVHPNMTVAGTGPVLDGGSSASCAFTGANRSYNTIEGFECKNFVLNVEDDVDTGVIDLQQTTGSVVGGIIRYNWIHTITADATSNDQAGIFPQGTNGWVISFNIIKFHATNPTGSGIRGSSVNRATIEGNYITNCNTGVYISQEGANEGENNILRNYITGSSSAAIWMRDHKRSVVAWNVVGPISSAPFGYESGLVFEEQNSFSDVEAHQCHHNTVIGPYTVGIMIIGQTDSNFANNIVYNCSTGYAEQYFGTDHPSGGTTSIHHSLNFSNTTNYFNAATSALVGAGMVNADPVFVASGNVPSPFYRLQTTSPAKNAGDGTVADGTDFDGNAVGASPDIGALEFQS